MKKSLSALAIFSFMLQLMAASPVLALDAQAQQQFDRIMAMSLVDLADASAALLVQRYPDEDWGRWHFPDYVFGDRVIETSYKVAVKAPQLLGESGVTDQTRVIPCYCSCETFGHDNLLYCFWKNGDPTGEFDEHASQCGICMRQAFLAFLWDSLGASHVEIMQGMEQKFAPLIKQHSEGKP